MSKLVVVFGATGTQGSGVVRELLKDKAWKVRAVTRNPQSDKAKGLESLGAEAVAGDFNKPETLTEAIEGAYAVFAVVNFWEHMFMGNDQHASGELEYTQGLAIVKAAAASKTLTHFIWSTLPAADVVSKGTTPVPHMDYKAKIDVYIKSELPDLAKKTTFMYIGFYASNMIYLPMLQPAKDSATGAYTFRVPGPQSLLLPSAGDASANAGTAVKAILEHPEITLPTRYVAVDEGDITFTEALNIWSKATGQKATLVEVSYDEYENSFGVFGKEFNAQLKFHEAFPGWNTPNLVTMKDLGVDKKLIDFEGGLKACFDAGAPVPN